MAGIYSCLRGKNDSNMASGPPEVAANQESAETPEECPGKKKSKFQTFKNFFVKKKRKEAPAPTEESPLKSSQSSDNVNGAEATPTHSNADQDSGSKVNMGSKAMSHDSVFVSESQSSEANEGLASSQDSLHGKVKSLQMQLKQAIRLGSPQAVSGGKRGEDGTISEDDGLPCSPPEISTLHTSLTGSSQRSSTVVQRTSSLSLEGSDSEDEQTSPEASSRPVSPLAALPLDFSEPASFTTCLDNSAARHRIAVKQRACAKRKPASRELFESSKVKILSGRVPLRVQEESVSEDLTEASAGEENKDVVMSETDGERQDSEAEGSISAQPALQVVEKEPTAPEEPSEAKDEDVSSSSSEDELDGEKSLPAADSVLDLPESPGSLSSPGGLHADTALDSEGEVPAEEGGSLLQEVLSSLECPLTSAFVLKPDSSDLHISEDQSNGLLDDPTEESSTSPAVNQEDDEEEEGNLPPSIDTRCSLDSCDEDEQLAKEEECVESDKGEVEEAEVVCPAEGLLEGDGDLPVGDTEETEEQQRAVEEEVMERVEVMEEEVQEAVVEEEEAVVEEVEDKEAVVEEEEAVVEEVEDKEAVTEEAVVEEEEAVMEEMEEEHTVMEEQKEVMEEDEVVTEKVVIQQQEVEEEEEEEDMELKEEVGEAEMTPEAPQQKAPAESEEEEYEEDVEVLKVEVATENHEPEEPEEIKEVEPEPDSGDLASGEDARALLPDSGPYSHTGNVASSEVTTELFMSEVREETSPSQPPRAVSPLSSEDLGTPQNKPSLSADISSVEYKEELCSGSSVQEDYGKDAPEPSKVRFTIAPAWQRSLSGGTPKEPPFPSPIKPEAFQQVTPETPTEPVASPNSPQRATPRSPVRQSPAQDMGAAQNPFGVKLRKTTVLVRYNVEGSGDTPATAEPEELIRRPQSGLASTKPVLPKKPDPLEDSTAKIRKTSDSLSRGSSELVTSPSWISMAKQKQKSFQENPIEESPGRKTSIEMDEANPSSSPVPVSCSLEISKPTALEKEVKRTAGHSPPVQAGQDEPPWLALAKKKAKAWSEMPQIVQ